jgi:hypothetical protein
MTALAFKRDSKPDFVQEDFARNRADLPGAGLAWLDARRRAAMDAFAATGIPTRRVEAWKYTDLANALESELEPATPFHGTLAEGDALAASDAHLLLVNGFLHRTRAANGVDIVDLGALAGNVPDWVKENLGLLAAGRDSPLGAASLALMRGGVAVRVRQRATLDLDFGSASLHYTFFLIERFGVSVQSAQLHLFLFLGAVAAGTFIGGPVGDRFGRKYVIWGSILGVLPFTLVLPYASLFWTAVLSVVIGLVIASAFSAILVYAQELLPGRVGFVAGLFFGFAFGIGGLGAAGLGWLADITGIVWVYRACAFLPLIGLLAVWLPEIDRDA